MSIATLTSKGQITIPKTVRDALGLATGDRVQFVQGPEGFHLVAANADISSLRGVLAGRRQQPASIADMDAAIARGLAKQSKSVRSKARR